MIEIWEVKAVHWEEMNVVAYGFDGCPKTFGIFGGLIDAFKIGRCKRRSN